MPDPHGSFEFLFIKAVFVWSETTRSSNHYAADDGPVLHAYQFQDFLLSLRKFKEVNEEKITFVSST